MRLNKPTPKHLSPSSGHDLSAVANLKLSDCPYHDLLAVIAEVLDSIAKGEDLFLIIGATSRKDSFSLTIKQDGQPTTVYGSSLVELSTQAGTLLEPPTTPLKG